MKLMSWIICFLFSIPSFACLELFGSYKNPTQEDGPDYLNLTVIKQNGCEYVSFTRASIYVPTGLYMENPNSSYYELDRKERCNAFGICYSAEITDQAMHIKHTPKEFTKANGDLCVSRKISFSIDQKKSLLVLRDCDDGTEINAIYKKY